MDKAHNGPDVVDRDIIKNQQSKMLAFMWIIREGPRVSRGLRPGDLGSVHTGIGYVRRTVDQGRPPPFLIKVSVLPMSNSTIPCRSSFPGTEWPTDLRFGE